MRNFLLPRVLALAMSFALSAASAADYFIEPSSSSVKKAAPSGSPKVLAYLGGSAATPDNFRPMDPYMACTTAVGQCKTSVGQSFGNNMTQCNNIRIEIWGAPAGQNASETYKAQEQCRSAVESAKNSAMASCDATYRACVASIPP